MSHALVSMTQQGLSQDVCNVVLKGTEDNTKWPRNWHSLRTTAGAVSHVIGNTVSQCIEDCILA